MFYRNYPQYAFQIFATPMFSQKPITHKNPKYFQLIVSQFSILGGIYFIKEIWNDLNILQEKKFQKLYTKQKNFDHFLEIANHGKVDFLDEFSQF